MASVTVWFTGNTMPKTVSDFRMTSCSIYLMLARIQISGQFELKRAAAVACLYLPAKMDERRHRPI
ncbi:hypothetical protein PH552_25615 [Rhizobium sp. CNPSo 3968]|nr:hypothetical protein [Rhizobium sp. CNPSo 3968]